MIELDQGHLLRIALIVSGIHESKIRFTFQLGVNYLILRRVKSSVYVDVQTEMRRDVLLKQNFSIRGAKCIGYQGLPIGDALSVNLIGTLYFSSTPVPKSKGVR